MKRITELSLQAHVKIHQFSVLLGAILIAIGCFLSQQGTLHIIAWSGIAIAAFGILWRILYVKCPHCGNSLYSNSGLPNYCPDCGKKLLNDQF